MPEIVPHRVGSLFNHRDSRLPEPSRPVVIKSVDATDLSLRSERRPIRFEYGFGGDGRLYVEVQVCYPLPQLHWRFWCFRIGDLVSAEARDLPDDLRSLAQEVEVDPVRLRTELVRHAPGLDSPRPETLGN